IGEARDVAAAAVFYASDEAEFITGTTLVVDGGMTAGYHQRDKSPAGPATAIPTARRKTCLQALEALLRLAPWTDKR
ncbi:MAG TPA: SDR family oxidoreductase, partial [Acidobacteriaceae bacterium]|nr:SDR family oxidoreductase [Acidobacteriaceae bacterium]